MLIQAPGGAYYLLSGGKMHHVTDPTSLQAYVASGIPQANTVTASELTALLADFPPGNPAVTVTSTIPELSLTGTIVPAAS
jgi:hypothetical protein